MPNVRILYDNRVTDAGVSVSATSEASGLPAAAVQNHDRAYVFRSQTGTGEIELEVDLGSEQLVSCLGVANVKLIGSGALTLSERGSGGSPGGATLVVPVPAQDANTRVAVVFFSGQAKRHFQLKWTNPGSDNDYAELGYLFLGQFFEPERNIRLPWAWSLVDPSVKRASVDGQLTTTTRSAYRAGSWQFPFVTEAERRTWVETIYGTVGQRVPWFAVPLVTAPWLAMLQRFSSNISAVYERSKDEYTITFDFEEAR